MKSYILNYDMPSDHSNKGWQGQVLPIGNGYMGLCMFGGVETEFLQFNEKTLWKGGPSSSRPNYNGGNIPNSYNYLKQIQKALEDNDYNKVLELKDKLVGIEDGYGCYQNFGELYIKFNHKNHTDYRRYLDINNAIAGVEYKIDGKAYKREYFASYPDRVMACKLTADEKFSFSIGFDSAQEGEVIAVNNTIICSGAVKDNGLNYYANITVTCNGQLSANGKEISINDANECYIYIVGATDYKDNYPIYRGEAPNTLVEKIVAKALSGGYDAIKSNHLKDYHNLFNRVNFDLGAVEPKCTSDKLSGLFSAQPMSNQGKYYQELLFQYGRYLIIASSREGSLPANLQGVWNNSNDPMWGCDYHLNVNLQMCYWHVFTTNLAETATPLLQYMESLRVAGRVTAKEYHNIVSDEKNPENGWVCHTQCTPFGWTCPGWDFYWGWSPAASSWMMQNCYDYYEFTGDKKVLKEKIYPMMKENAKFWLQNLVYNAKQDRWVSSPSFSPEHGPISVGNTYEQEMIYILFNDTIQAGKILGDSAEFLAQLTEIKDKLSPLHVGKWGQVKEWYEEDEWYKFSFMRKLAYKKHRFSPKHRHASHLIGLYPAKHINKSLADIYNASKVSLNERGLGGVGNKSGWGKANKIGMWARLHDGEMAFTLIKSLLSNNIESNMWDMHPPYQMDGNCGYTAGVAEMLVNSCQGEIELLPALPLDWKDGSVSGIVARGGYTVDIKWKNNKVVEYAVYSKSCDTVKVNIGGKIIVAKTNMVNIYE